MKTILRYRQIENPALSGHFFSTQKVEVTTWQPEEIREYISYLKRSGQCDRFSISADGKGPFDVDSYLSKLASTEPIS